MQGNRTIETFRSVKRFICLHRFGLINRGAHLERIFAFHLLRSDPCKLGGGYNFEMLPFLVSHEAEGVVAFGDLYTCKRANFALSFMHDYHYLLPDPIEEGIEQGQRKIWIEHRLNRKQSGENHERNDLSYHEDRRINWGNYD